MGKLDLNRPLLEIIREQQDENRIEILPVEVAHVFGLQDLPNHHKDPFDRLLIAQAIVEGLPVLSVDSIFGQYPIRVLSA